MLSTFYHPSERQFIITTIRLALLSSPILLFHLERLEPSSAWLLALFFRPAGHPALPAGPPRRALVQTTPTEATQLGGEVKLGWVRQGAEPSRASLLGAGWFPDRLAPSRKVSHAISVFTFRVLFPLQNSVKKKTSSQEIQFYRASQCYFNKLLVQPVSSGLTFFLTK